MTTLEVIEAINTTTSRGFYPTIVSTPSHDKAISNQEATMYFCEQLRLETMPKSVKRLWQVEEKWYDEIIVTEI